VIIDGFVLGIAEGDIKEFIFSVVPKGEYKIINRSRLEEFRLIIIENKATKRRYAIYA
jgi:hypothetical protein